MAEPQIKRHVSEGVTLLGDPERPGGVTLAFTERTGGVSGMPYASLNLGDRTGDAAENVAENRRRALAAIGAAGLSGRLVNPWQVHGDRVVTITDGSDEAVRQARKEALSGADAVVCTASDVPVLLCYADCVPVILAAQGGFAVIHSGWKGTMLRIAARAARELERASSTPASGIRAYIGPHIGGADYEVSEELLERFVRAFGPAVVAGERHLDLEAAVRQALGEAGLRPDNVVSTGISTASATDRFFSYRAEGGTCGRHGALALIRSGAGIGR